jgi:hypothetical protein
MRLESQWPVGQRLIELSFSHPTHGLMKCGSAAVVEVGRCGRHTAQARHAQDLGFRRGEMPCRSNRLPPTLTP